MSELSRNLPVFTKKRVKVSGEEEWWDRLCWFSFFMHLSLATM